MPITAGFQDRYDAVLAKWPVAYECLDVSGPFGSTHINVCGAENALPVLLIPGGRSTSAGWYANVGALAPVRRVYAVDLIGDSGRSIPAGAAIKSRAGLVAWLDGVLDALGLEATALGGHSYGAWIAARYAIARPERVTRLVLIDPTDTLCSTRPGFRLRGVPLFLGRRQDRYLRFYRWETGGRQCDAQFADLWSGPSAGPSAGNVVWPRKAGRAELARLTMPVLVIAAGRSRQNDPAALAAGARRLPDARTVLVPDATHFTVTHCEAAQINAALADFLA
jgi:pimeloyl-ACP methyl ester carboxylesterase